MRRLRRDSTWVPVKCGVPQVAERVNAPSERKLRLTGTNTDHATEALLASSVPKLETNLDAVHGNFLGDEKSTSCGSSVLWIELVLSVSL